MNNFIGKRLLISMLGACLLSSLSIASEGSPLSSWNKGYAKSSIISVVKQVTDTTSKFYVSKQERIAVFDLDGTLIPEQPMYSKLYFALLEINSSSRLSSQWRKDALVTSGISAAEPQKSREYILKHDKELMFTVHNGLMKDNYQKDVLNWFDKSLNPQSHRQFKSSAYKPMKQLIRYLEKNGFKVYIVTGTDTDFVRPIVQQLVGVSPTHVIGTQFGKNLIQDNGNLAITYKNDSMFYNIQDNKVLNIDSIIGIRPIIAFGNSDDDMSMLRWTDESKGLHLSGLIHHTDAKREWAYDRKGKVGKLDKALEYGKTHHWTIVDMKKDWKTIY
ncbi:haloacid dehalogenase-like hydrolase [Shewanella sp. 202IG2-18]|uniref:HAD family hydrolase n=1 Tax=Parashewanella hymeniacidonis TaxID=2807618 RepID=UPI00195FA039|nr:HAD family hydrolase [Parashewanella hymeniacidonis]MBM7073317.1 haloacid dehalogenase-like hydrolase [Parashewanella hymeniacidonis]